MFGMKSKKAGGFKSDKPANPVRLVMDLGGAPAVSLEKVDTSTDAGISLVKKANKAGVSLSKRSLSGLRGRVILLLDHSGSMFSDYMNGTVQELTERALGFALQVDTDGALEIRAFDDVLHGVVKAGAVGGRGTVPFAGVVDSHIWQRGKMRGTYMAQAFDWVRKEAAKTKEPIFLIVIGDGSPSDRGPTTEVVKDLARYPVFIKFLAVRPVDYLEQLDDLPNSERMLDNVDAKFIGDPAGMTDLAFADAMLDEVDTWIEAALAAGVLTR